MNDGAAETNASSNGGVYFDGHMHTTHSDGVLDVPSLAQKLHAARVQAAVLTDHDTTKGSDEFCQQLKRLNQHIETFVGAEMSTGHALDGEDKERHILAYFWNPNRHSEAWQRFDQALLQARSKRREHLPRYIEKLASLGMPLGEADILQHASEETVGRPHIARAMIARGYVASVNEAFDRFLGAGKPAFILRQYASAKEMIELATAAGAVTSLAHPHSSKVDRREIEVLKSYGLAAIEAYHPSHDGGLTLDYLRLADSLGLLVSGGSDFHGGSSEEGATRPGTCGLPKAAYLRLRESLKARA